MKDQLALDMADYTLERLSLNAKKWTYKEREALGRDLLRYATGLAFLESK